MPGKSWKNNMHAAGDGRVLGHPADIDIHAHVRDHPTLTTRTLRLEPTTRTERVNTARPLTAIIRPMMGNGIQARDSTTLPMVRRALVYLPEQTTPGITRVRNYPQGSLPRPSEIHSTLLQGSQQRWAIRPASRLTLAPFGNLPRVLSATCRGHSIPPNRAPGSWTIGGSAFTTRLALPRSSCTLSLRAWTR